MSDERTIQMLHRVLDEFNRHDLDAIMAHFAEDCVFEAPRGPDPWGRRFFGKAEVRSGLSARFEGIPDVHYGEADHFACGPRGVSEWTITGTDLGRNRIEVRGCDLWTIGDNGKIVRKDSSGSYARRRSRKGPFAWTSVRRCTWSRAPINRRRTAKEPGLERPS